MVIWIIGLSGSGKTTIGRSLAKDLKAQYPNTIFLDGDIIRHIIGDNLGFTLEDRMQSGWRICRLCQHLDQEGMIVVCSVISLFDVHRTWNRNNYSKYFEVFLDVPIKELQNRDPKGLYQDFSNGKIINVAGLDLKFEKPTQSDFIIKNTEPLKSPQYWSEMLMSALKLKELIC